MDDDIYHYDFTTASDLEIFIARLEEIIQDWKLHRKPRCDPSKKKNCFEHSQWFSSFQCLTFTDAEFKLVRYYLKCDSTNATEEEDFKTQEEIKSQTFFDMMSMENDFFPAIDSYNQNLHPIARWYGLKDFLVLIPQHSCSVASESRIKVLLSAVTIACNNVKCKVPVFIQALEPWQLYFFGTFQAENFRTEFNMVHLKQTPVHCKFLTGVLNMFKSKIGCGMLLNSVSVSVQFTYVLKEWAQNSWPLEPHDLDLVGGEPLSISEINKLPFGSAFDSVTDLILKATWPSLLESSFMDAENYSDLDPLQETCVWKVSVKTLENPSCLLTDCFTEFLMLTNVKNSMKELLGSIINNDNYSGGGMNEISSSLNVLTESKISAFSKAVIGKDRKSKRDQERKYSSQLEKPIANVQLMILLYYLFPDADENSKSLYSENLGGQLPSLSDVKPGIVHALSEMKSAPFDGLLWRLSIAMAHVIHSLGGVRSAAYLWYEFTQELRFRWENGILIQGVEARCPDPKTCLLNQKLQLLNCCISRRIQRDNEALEAAEENSDSDREDEFFDAESGEENFEIGGRRLRIAAPDKPMGRLAKLGDLKLLETGEPLYIPVTQESVPKTEDQLEEDTQVLLKLGTDQLGSELRARLLSKYVLSDMEAFKAANPGCVLADFIRWCSPRDWIEEENGDEDEFGQKKGRLSSRMEIPGNTWSELWQVARPSPAKWQKRLFNDTREAEKVLDFLERKSPGEFAALLLPVFAASVVKKLSEEAGADDLPSLNETLAKLIRKVERLGKMPKIEGESYKELTNEILAIETLLLHLKSLKRKFLRSEEEPSSDVNEFIKNLLTKDETEVPGGPESKIGALIRQQFLEAAKGDSSLLWDSGTALTSENFNATSQFPNPHEKEMILRLWTAGGPQRLHAVLKKNECRFCGAFSKNLLLPNN